MVIRTVCIAAGLLFATSVHAGYYSSIDVPMQEMRWNIDYPNVFNEIVNNLRAIPSPQVKRDYPLRNRYVLIEAIGRDGVKLDTLQQKLDYSSVLIRRNRADEAVQLLLPMAENEYSKHFLVLAHCATAHFLGSQREFRVKAPYYMKQALKYWPAEWKDMKEEDQKLLLAFGWAQQADLDGYRLYETYLERLIKHRVDEEKRLLRKEKLEVAVDPIFNEPKEKPLRFVNDKGEFEPGGLAAAEKEKLPRIAVEIVEQLVMWMPNDDRLFWLLGEVFNATAAQETDQKEKNLRIASARMIFEQLEEKSFKQNVYGKTEIAERRKILAAYKLPETDRPKVDLPGDEKDDPEYTRRQFWRALVVSFITGLSVGIFALWQLQEMRRRRQAKTAAT